MVAQTTTTASNETKDHRKPVKHVRRGYPAHYCVIA